MTHEGTPTGSLGLRKVAPIRRPAVLTVADAMRYGGGPKGLLGKFGDLNAFLRRTSLRRRMEWQEANAENFQRSLAAQQAAEDAVRGGVAAMLGHLWLAKVDRAGGVTDLGLASCRVVTNAGVAYIVDAFQNLTELENLKYHALGTGTTAEAATQTTLVTELTTQYSTASTRPTGTLGEQSGNANIFESIATIAVSATVAATEHGLFSAAASGTGTMLDRSVFAAVNLVAGESIAATYDFTIIAGG